MTTMRHYRAGLDQRRRSMRGKSLPETGYKLKKMVIYRAGRVEVSRISPMDYVTRTQRWARQHADHMAVTEEEPYTVLKAMVPAEHVYAAPNPGEFFYDGPQPVRGRVVYTAQPPPSRFGEFEAREAARSLYGDDPNWSLEQEEHWGGDGSGCLLVAKSDPPKILLLKRSSDVTEPGTWGIPGGARPIHRKSGRIKPSWNSAVDETKEELGGLPPGFGQYKKKVTYRDPEFKYDNYIVLLPVTALEWRPKLDWENSAYSWFTMDALPKKLHFGVKWLLKRFDPTKL